MTLLKYIGPLLTYEQVFAMASKIAGREYTNTDNDVDMANGLSVFTRTVEKRFPEVELWPTSEPRHSQKTAHQRLLFVCRAYKIPYENPNSYAEVPATKREAKYLIWLARQGMDWDDMLKQWTTLPDPAVDDRD